MAEDLARVWRPLGKLPDRLCSQALARLPLPPVTMAQVLLGPDQAQVGDVVLVPFSARQLLEQPGAGRARVEQAVDHAARRGARVVGLGALTAPVTGGGVALRGRSDIGVTNGNAFTAAIVEEQARHLLDRALPSEAGRHVAVVGATGSVGTAVVELLARDRSVDRFTLVARSAGRLAPLQARASRTVPTEVATDLGAVATADLVILLTASADALLRPEHLRAGAVVLDGTQPRNTSPDLLVGRPDVLVIDGGVVSVPSLRLRGGDIGLPPGRAYACLAETALLALSGHPGHFSLGVPRLEQVDHVRSLAAGLSHLGFVPAEPTSFGRPVAVSSTGRALAVAVESSLEGALA